MARFGFLSSYPPTRCGLATFTENLAESMLRPHDEAFVVRVLDEYSPSEPSRSRGMPVVTMRNGDKRSVAAAIRALNSADVAIVQHEYGIFAGRDGDEVLEILGGLTAPSVVVLHTVLSEPTAHQRRVLERVAHLATAVVVMTEAARTLLLERYAIGRAAVTVIPHGVLPLPLPASATPPWRRNDYRPVVLTWGLLGPGKGIEWGIRAFAELVDLDPMPRYRVLGQTHPKVLALDGDTYRQSLRSLVTSLGLDDVVTIDGRYLSSDNLAHNLVASDAVLLPYDSRVQVTSGVLSEAVAAGKPVVATAFPHAVELVNRERGRVVPHQDPGAIADALRDVLGRRHGARAASSGAPVQEDTSWASVGARFRNLAVGLRSTVAA